MKAEFVAVLAERIRTMDNTDDADYVAEHHFLPSITRTFEDWLRNQAHDPGDWGQVFADSWREEMGS